MMTRRSGHLLFATLVAAYGFAILCASALHSSVGSKHKVAAATGGNEEPAALSPSHDDCPICHFQAQGQVVIASDRQVCTDVVQIRPLDEPPLLFPPLPARLSAPRAPPIA